MQRCELAGGIRLVTNTSSISRKEVIERVRNAGFDVADEEVLTPAAMAVLQVIDDECLIENARDVGAYALERMRDLQTKHSVIGDVRGAGLFFGAEMVLDEAMTPATAYTERVVEGMKARGILLNRLGFEYATLKIRPPMVFSRENADLLIDTLDEVLTSIPVSA